MLLVFAPAGELLSAPQIAAPTYGDLSSRPAPAWVTLDGRPVLEIRSAAGVNTPAVAARLASAALRDLAENSVIPPERLVVREDPPYSMVGVLAADGRFEPRLAVDDRAAAAFGLTRQDVAEQYRDSLRGAIRQYRSSHSLAFP